VPSQDSLLLPTGIRLQTIFTTTNPPATPPNRYLGYNPPYTSAPVNVGGCILFDGNGKLIVRPYGFQMELLNGSTPTLSPLGSMLFGPTATFAGLTTPIVYTAGGIPYSTSYVPGYASSASITGTSPLWMSQLGIVMFDQDAFSAQGFLDADTDPNEAAKQTWIDANSTPVLINRYDGTLIRTE
jgi:hypothetical protein